MNGKWTQGLAGLLAAVLLMPTPAALAAEIGGVEDSPTGSASNAATVDIANGSGSKVQFEPNGEVELTDGKSASFTGAMIMGFSTQLFNTSRAGVAALSLLFPLGLLLLRKAMKIPSRQ